MDRGLEMLLDLDGTVLVQTDAGHWALVRARRVKASREKPHGISYSLTTVRTTIASLAMTMRMAQRNEGRRSIIATDILTTRDGPTNSVQPNNC